MEDLIEAIKSNDLVAVKKAFAPLMAEKTTSLIEARKIEIAQSVMIEGEEPKDEDGDEDKSDKDESEKDTEDDKEEE